MTVKRVFALATVVAAAAFAASAQTRELNPTVKVLARPQSPVPPECATDQTVLPALEAEAPALEPATAPAPPSNDLRSSLRRLQVAADVNDYAEFKSALADARRAAAAHPAGGERNAANDALQVFADLARVWDYAMTAPTGGFFDATVQGGSLLNAMKGYPDYGHAIADQTINSGGRTLYPTPETRRFLARESARRLSRLGVSIPAKVARGTQPEPAPRHTVTVPPPPVKKPVQRASKPTKTTTPKKTAAKTPTPKTTTTKPAAKTAKATPPAKTKSAAIKTTPVPKPKAAAKPPVKVADTSTIPPGPPIVSTPQPKAPAPTTTTTASSPTQTATNAPVTTTTAPPPASTSTTDTTVSTTSSTPTDTSVTAAPDTAATSSAVPPSKQNGNMNLILAVVLILVGIGVLVVLFRASD